MKRSLMLITLLFFLTLLTNAQINRTICGITLGSAKDSALVLLKEKGFELMPNQDPSNGGYVLMQNFTFGGITWDGMIVNFLENRLSSIMLLYASLTFDDCQSKTSLLLGNLMTKYKEYADKPEMNSDDRSYIKMLATFDDGGKTMLALSSEMYIRKASNIKLLYADTEIMNNDSLKSIQEL